MKKFEDIITRFDRIQRAWQTDGQTDTAWRHRPRLCIALRGKNVPIYYWTFYLRSCNVSFCHTIYSWPTLQWCVNIVYATNTMKRVCNNEIIKHRRQRRQVVGSWAARRLRASLLMQQYNHQSLTSFSEGTTTTRTSDFFEWGYRRTPYYLRDHKTAFVAPTCSNINLIFVPNFINNYHRNRSHRTPDLAAKIHRIQFWLGLATCRP